MLYRKIFLFLIFVFIAGIFLISANHTQADTCCILKGPNTLSRYVGPTKEAMQDFLNAGKVPLDPAMIRLLLIREKIMAIALMFYQILKPIFLKMQKPVFGVGS